MRKLYIILFVSICFNLFQNVSFADIKLTDEQFENMDVLHKKLARAYPETFVGLTGEQEGIKCLGITDKQCTEGIKNLDIPSEIAKDPQVVAYNSAIERFKKLDFTDDELKAVNIERKDEK